MCDELRLVKFKENLLFYVIGGVAFSQIARTMFMAAAGQLNGPIACGTA
jgi:hypothetical protein